MKRKHGHFARNALLVASFALAVPPVVIYEEGQELLAHRRPGR